MHNEKIDKILVEICEQYNYTESPHVLSELCRILSDLLRYEYKRDLSVHIDDDGRVLVHDYDFNRDISPKIINKNMITCAGWFLQNTISYLDSRESQYFCNRFLRNIVRGRIVSYNDELKHYTVEISGLNMLGYYKLMDIPPNERNNISKHEQRYFYTKRFYHEEATIDIFRPILILSRIAKAFPASLIKYFSNNQELEIITHSRNSGKCTVMTCKTPIKRSILKAVRNELNGESIRFKELKPS